MEKECIQYNAVNLSCEEAIIRAYVKWHEQDGGVHSAPDYAVMSCDSWLELQQDIGDHCNYEEVCEGAYKHRIAIVMPFPHSLVRCVAPRQHKDNTISLLRGTDIVCNIILKEK